MKKLFTLTIMLITLAMNAQDYVHVSNPVVDVAIFKGSDAAGPDNALTVPDGYFLTFSENAENYWKWTYPDGSTTYDNTIYEDMTMLPEGFKFYSIYDYDNVHLIVLVHEYASSGSTFSYSEAELNSSVKLFPNPTTSEVALNSEKTYEIEVFDILGNKVMELVGNSINMEHLSNATYIINALDVESRESLSYKVIKK